MCDYKVMRMRARSVGLVPFIYGIFQYFFSICSVFSVFFSIYNMMRMRARSVGLFKYFFLNIFQNDEEDGLFILRIFVFGFFSQYFQVVRPF